MTKRRPRTATVVEAFIVSRRAKGCSPKYEAWLRYTLGFLARRYASLPDAPEPLEAVLGTLPTCPRTRFGVWSSWRLLYRWAGRRGLVSPGADPMELVERPPDTKSRVLRTLTREEVGWVLQVNRSHLRDRALLRLLFDTGARIGEIHAVTRKNLGRDDDAGCYTVSLTGKTGARVVPITPVTFHELEELGPEPWGELTLNGLQKAVRRALARANLHGGPHLLRHTFGRLYVTAGGDVFSLQRMMGHAKIATTEVYVGLDLRDLARQHARFSPVATASEGRQLRLVEAS